VLFFLAFEFKVISLTKSRAGKLYVVVVVVVVETVKLRKYLKKMEIFEVLSIKFNLHNLSYLLGHALAHLVMALRQKVGGRGFDSPWCDWNLSLK
jgi:hypothetical protein